MLNKNRKKIPKLIIALIVFSLSILFFPALNKNTLSANPSIQKNVSSPEDFNPIIIYYSRTGNTRLVANTLKDLFSCEIAEIKSTIDRESFFTCALDSVLNRDDKSGPFEKDLKGYNPVILASPIWIRKLSSPIRTFIKGGALEGKNVFLVITYRGDLSEEKEEILKKEISSHGVNLKDLYKIVTKEKTEEEIKKDVITQLNEKPILKIKASN